MGSIVRALLSLRGRLRRGQFWVAWFLVCLGGAFSSQSQQNAASAIVGLLTLYVALCVYGKRLHDFGKTAWYMIVPIGGTFGTYAYLAAELSRIGSSSWQQLGQTVQAAYAVLLAFWALVTLWVGFHPSQKGDNRFGMDPRELRKVPTAPPKGVM